jgi:type I restriction enzyme S subunit
MLEGIQLLSPPLELQRKFETEIAAVDRLRTKQQMSLSKLNELFASLQHRAFRGELFTGHPDDKPLQLSLPRA